MKGRALLAFAIALPTLALGTSLAFRAALRAQTPLLDQDSSLQERLPTAWTDRQITRISKIRERREFWAFEKSNVHGSALKLLEAPELRSALFPGFPEKMFQDDELWRTYSGRDFSSTAWLPPLQSRSSPGVLVYHSWLGCLDIHRRYGADVIVFGSSETFRSLVPAVLSGHPSARRILFCTTTYSYPQQAEWLARELAKAGMPKSAWVILGVSLWSLYQDHVAFQSAQAEKKLLWDRYLNSRYGHFAGDFKPSEAFHAPAWDELYLPNLSLLNRHRSRIREAADPESFFARNAHAQSEGLLLPAVLRDPAKVGKFFEGFRPSFPLFHGLDERECRNVGEDRTLRQAVASIGAIAEKTLLYVPPISPRMRKLLPPCYPQQIERVLDSLGDKTVFIQAKHAEDYGLTDADYIYAGDIEGVVKFDAVHTNYVGALKVSSRVAELLAGGAR